MSEDTPAPSVVRVQPHVGQPVGERSMYIPLRPDFMLPDEAVEFDVYWRTNQNRLRVVLHKGETYARRLRDEVSAMEGERFFYVRADEKQDLVRYQERAVVGILERTDVPLNEKCELVQSLTTSLSQEVLESPNANNIFRQRRNIFRLVDFALHDEHALHGLMRLTHHDYYTYTHSVNVGLYALSIATAHLGHGSKHNLHEVAAAFFLHDVGKCQIHSDIINKPGPLSEEEWIEIRKHPDYGYRILEREKSLTKELLIVVLQHHERMDGVGYPKALRGEEIHPYARICSIADAFDALTTNRSYKKALKPFDALAVMKEEMHAQFDPDIFRTFVLLMRKRPR